MPLLFALIYLFVYIAFAVLGTAFTLWFSDWVWFAVFNTHLVSLIS